MTGIALGLVALALIFFLQTPRSYMGSRQRQPIPAFWTTALPALIALAILFCIGIFLSALLSGFGGVLW